MRRLACAWVLAAAACGTIREAAVDAAVDAATPDADAAIVRGEVRVTVLAGGDATVGALVFYHDASGASVTDAIADSDGKVTFADVPDGGVVTVIRDVEEHRLVSMMGVRVGDALTFDTPTAVLIGPPGSAGTISVTLPPDAADEYEIESSCRRGSIPTGAASATVNIDISDRCPDTNDVDIAVYGKSAGARVSYQSSKSAAVGGSVSFLSVENIVTYEITPPAIDAQAQAELVPLAASGRSWDYSTVEQTTTVASAPPALFARAGGDTYPLVRSRMVLEPNPALPDLFVNHELTQIMTPSAADGGTESIDATNHLPFVSTLELIDDVPFGVDFTVSEALECGDLGGPDVIGFNISATVPSGGYLWSVVAPGDRPFPVYLPRFSDVTALQFWPQSTFETVALNISIVAISNRTWDEYRLSPGADDLSRKNVLLGSGDSSCTSNAALN